MTDSAEFKRRQQAAIQAGKESRHSSILDSFKLPQEEVVDAGESHKTTQIQRCPLCEQGLYQGIFGKSECAACHGTGFDLSDPVNLIRGLVAGGRKLRKEYQGLKREFREFKGMWTEDEIKRRAEALFVAKHSSRFD